MASILPAVDIALGILVIFIVHRLIFRTYHASLPPGPKGYPLIGNVLDMPASYEWLTFAKWRGQWGDIISVTLLGQPIVILNSAQHAYDLLEKRSSIYSDRPTLIMGGEIVGYNRSLALTPYGTRLRETRRLFHRIMGSRAHVEGFYGLEEVETRRFIKRIFREPERLSAHIRKTAGAIILMISHGYSVVPDGADPIVDLVDLATEEFALATSPGAFLVDALPMLRYIPSWFPGAGFQKKAVSWAKTLNDMADIPHEFVKRQMSAGLAIPNFTSKLLENEELTGDKELNIKWAAASLYAAGADTTVSAIYGFFLAMTLYPEVQRRAQAEIDTVIGNDRLPGFEDREHLPYIDALVKEVLRFNSVAPLGLPHRATEDDTHAGYFIPKGSIIIANIWLFLHDPEVYANPMVFDPRRFLPSEGETPEPDPRDMCFGFGRRICPGLHLADASVFISCAMVLALFDITKAVENGQVIEPVNEYTSGTISHPKPFKCTIKARSPKAEALIRSIDG